MTGPPELRDLLGDDLPPEERARLQRVHELLVAAGPPPELPPSLAETPDRAAQAPSWLPRRRVGAAFALAATIALVAFVGGYVAGYERSDNGFDAARSVVLGKAGAKRVVVRFGQRDANGNRAMLVSVQGLSRARDGNYYTLFMTKDGRPLVTCGTFNVEGEGLTTLRFTIAYELERFDGLLLAEYHHSDHKDYPLLRAKLA
jgi:hypothetical protein